MLLLALILLALAAWPVMGLLIPGVIRRAAAARGLSASWAQFDLAPPLEVRIRGLTVVREVNADTLVRAESLAVGIDPWALLILRKRVTSVRLAHAAITIPARHGADPDTVVPEGAARSPDKRWNPERAARLRSLARSLVDMLAAPAHELPRLSLHDVTLAPETPPARAGDDETPIGVRIAWLALTTGRPGVHFAGEGRWLAHSPLPFTAALDYRRDDRLSGMARIAVPAPGRSPSDTLRIAVDGALAQDRDRGAVVIADSTRLSIGSLRFRLGGEASREGPRFRLALVADTLTARQWQESLPRAVLGPLLDLSVRGWYGYRVGLDLDLTRPDSVGFTAAVQPHGLRLDSLATRLDLLRLGQPFIASIHLPHDQIVTREISPANPHFRPLVAIDSTIANAVVTNEDGAFFRHRGFNPEAVRGAIADNVKAGAYRRGAGTITMQLVRNLYLGHQRTLSRKGQEVVLAWVLEHLTTVSKARMLEIYLNIIEWGPGVMGADEATHYYFGHDAGRVTVDEALFLATVVPAPTRWRNRFDGSGALRPFARAQMHFIGRAMVQKGRLSPELLPAADSLRVELRGPARDVLFPPPEAHADTTAT
jgi:hypothetical protein